MYDLNTEKQSSEENMVRTRDVCCILTIGVVIFALGITGGLFIGIYAYHGGPDGIDRTINVDCLSGQQGRVTGADTTTAAPETTQARTPRPSTTTASATTPTSTKTPNECEVKACPKRNSQSDNPMPEIFAPLTNAEMTSIREFMVQEGVVDDKLGDELTLTSDYIITMDSFQPSKQDVVKYLDHVGPYPGRYARVVVVRGSRPVPDVMTYLVGPLSNTSISLKQLDNDGDVAWEARPIDGVEVGIYMQLLEPVGQILEPLMKESFDGGSTHNGTLSWWPYEGPPGPLEKEREAKMHLYISPLDEYDDRNLLDFLPLICVIHCPGNDASTWKVYNFYYLNQGPFSTAEELLSAYNNGTIRKMSLPDGYLKAVPERAHVGRDFSKPLRDNAEMPPPRTYEPMGQRYDIEGHSVKWMGWSFDVTTKMMRGGAIFDIRFKNTKIAYELALNEIALIYASDSHGRSNVVYTDSTYGIGLYDGVIKGVDCPEHASLLETSFYSAWSGEGSTARSVCVFESDAEGAAWRHKYTSWQGCLTYLVVRFSATVFNYDYFVDLGGLRKTYLVVRFSATVYNYDYLVDYEFHLDGKLFVKVKATGFIQTDFWDAANPNRDASRDSADARDAFGFQVSDNSQGIIHDHMFGFKVDLDVIDTNNSFEVIHFKAGKAVDAFKSQNSAITEKPEYFTFNHTRYLEYETVQTERGYRLDLENPKFWTIVNENYRNRWGAKRGFQLLPLSSALQTMVSAHPAMQALSFTKNTLTATKRKDSEPYLTSIFDGFRFDNTKGDLDKHVDGEDIVNEDIVNWMAIGFLHIPTSEDVPMTVTLETGFILKPFNFFNETDIFDMPGYYRSMDGKREDPPEFEPCLETD